LSNFGHTTKNLFTTPQGWWTLGQCGLYYGSCLAALYVTLRMPDDFVHPDTLRWYVHTHTPYEATTQLMKEAIIHLRDKAPEQIKIDYHKQLLKDSFDRLVRYGEGICAYMTYKTKQLDEHERLVAERAARYFFVYYNAWLANVAAQYALDVPDYDALEKLITTYETEMGSQLCHFYAIEGETKRDKRAVRKRE
jgi:hypothetical protein